MYLIKAICTIKYKEIDLKTIDELQSWIETKSNLINCWNWKPMINGNDLLKKYSQYGLGRDSRITKLNQHILQLRLSKPNITIEELHEPIIEWLKLNPAPKHKQNNNRKSRRNRK